MKANEAPEKIYCHRNELGYLAYSDQPFNYAKEYIRTDAFIEKAIEWLRKNADDYVWYDETEGESGMMDGFIEVFIDYMKGE